MIPEAGSFHITAQDRGLIEKAETKPWGFAELQRKIDFVYSDHNERCGYTPDTILGKLTGNATNLRQFARREKGVELMDKALTIVFAWTISYANEAGVDIQKTMSEKFGKGCPHCFQMPCVLAKGQECVPPEIDPRPFRDVPVPETLSEWQSHLKELYSVNFKDNEFSDKKAKEVCLKIVEEAGELSAASYDDVQKLQSLASFNDGMDPVESELADVVAWSFALANGLDILYEGYSLEDSMREKYGSGCPSCGQPQCVCPKATTVISQMKERSN